MPRREAEPVSDRLASWSVSLAPDAVNLGEGLRAAASCATMAAAAIVFDQAWLGLAAISAFWACIADPGGPTRDRLTHMLGLAVAGPLIAIACSWAAGLGWVAAVAALGLCALAAGLARAWGGAPAALSNLLVLTAVIGAARPATTLAPLAAMAGGYVAGCLWAMLLALTVWRIHPYAQTREALAAAFRTLAAMAAALAERTLAGDADTARDHHDRRAAREALEAARQRLERAATGRQEADGPAARLTTAVDMADNAFARLIALADLIERRPPEGANARTANLALRRLALVLQRAGRFVFDQFAHPAALARATQALRRATAALPPRLKGPLADSASLGEALADPRATPHAAEPVPAPGVGGDRRLLVAPLREAFAGEALTGRHALRLAVCVCAAFLIARRLSIPFGYWMTITVAITLQPYMASTWLRSLERVIGTVAGGLLAVAIGMLAHSRWPLLIAIFPLAAVAMTFRRVNYSLFVLFVTPLFVLILDLGQPGLGETRLAATRALDTLAGGGLALAGSLLLWPQWSPDALRRAIATAIERNGRFAERVLAGAPPDDAATDAARRAAGLASNAAEAARHRAMLETFWRRDEAEAARAALAAVRGLAGTAISVWLRAREPGEDGALLAAGWMEAASADLAAAARERRAPAPRASPPGDLAPAAQRLLERLEVLRGAVARLSAR